MVAVAVATSDEPLVPVGVEVLWMSPAVAESQEASVASMRASRASNKISATVFRPVGKDGRLSSMLLFPVTR
jgi:hypothetical protein